jgi:hypothetical protein
MADGGEERARRALRRRRPSVAVLPAAPLLRLPSLPKPRDEQDPVAEPVEATFVCSVCRRDMSLLERSRIARSKCRACV